MPTICVDGFNIALTNGSGIATYGRNLLSNLREIGLGTQVLYGPPRKRGKNDVLNETALVEAGGPPTKFRKSERFKRTFMSRFEIGRAHV